MSNLSWAPSSLSAPPLPRELVHRLSSALLEHSAEGNLLRRGNTERVRENYSDARERPQKTHTYLKMPYATGPTLGYVHPAENEDIPDFVLLVCSGQSRTLSFFNTKEDTLPITKDTNYPHKRQHQSTRTLFTFVCLFLVVVLFCFILIRKNLICIYFQHIYICDYKTSFVGSLVFRRN